MLSLDGGLKMSAQLRGHGRRGPSAGADVGRHLVGQMVDPVQMPSAKQSERDGGGKRVAGADGVFHCAGKPGMIGAPVLRAKDAAARAPGVSHQPEIEAFHERLQLLPGRAGEMQQFRPDTS